MTAPSEPQRTPADPWTALDSPGAWAEALAGADAAEVAGIVAEAPDALLREVMGGEGRGPALEEIFRRFPEFLHEERTQGVNAAVRFKLTGGPGEEADRWTVLIDDGTCRAERGGDAVPRVTISLDGTEFLKLVTGNANPVMMFFRRRLRIHGDLGFAAQLTAMFKIPSAAG